MTESFGTKIHATDDHRQALHQKSIDSSYCYKINNILRQWRQLQQEKKQCQQHTRLACATKQDERDEFDHIMDEDLENQLKELERQEDDQYQRMEQIIKEQLHHDNYSEGSVQVLQDSRAQLERYEISEEPQQQVDKVSLFKINESLPQIKHKNMNIDIWEQKQDNITIRTFIIMSTSCVNPITNANLNLNEQIFKDLMFDNEDNHHKQHIRLVKQYNTSTIRRQTTVSPIKLALSKAMGMDLETIPHCLSRQNDAFEKKIHSILPTSITMEELRNIALVMYKIITLEIVQSLWIVYRNSGNGTLPSILATDELNTKIWPKEIHTYVKLCKIQQHHKTDEDHCLTLVNHCLCQFDKQIEKYRQQLNVKTSHLIGYTHSLEYAIEKFVQQSLMSKRMEIDREIALVQYDYTNQLLKRAFLAQNPK